MVTHIGHDQMEASSLGTNSVWNSIRRIYEKMIKEDVEKVTLNSATTEEVRKTVTEKMETLDTNFHGLKTFAQEKLSKMVHKIRALKNKHSTGSGVINSLEYKRLLDRIGIVDEIMECPTTDVSKGERNVSRIDAEVTNLKRKFVTINSTSDYYNFASPSKTI
jgi:predicted aconitase